ncbi:putative leucine-rich repeat domain superfamily [Helianthus annuus]|nr:putative leucine-rich repeat domain superfamily [Helianthus annuus]
MDDLFEVSKVKVVETAKLENLKILSLKFYDLDDTSVMSSSTIFELLGSLPKLQELDLDFQDCQLREGGAKKRSFPNLQTLELTTTDLYDVQTPAICSQEVEYNTTELLQLRSVTFEYLKGSENEVCLIKYLLACSPFLKSIVIRPYSYLAYGKKLMFATKLLNLYRASPVVEINIS